MGEMVTEGDMVKVGGGSSTTITLRPALSTGSRFLLGKSLSHKMHMGSEQEVVNTSTHSPTSTPTLFIFHRHRHPQRHWHTRNTDTGTETHKKCQ